MKQLITIIFSILVFNLSSAQHTDEYKSFVKEFVKIDSKPYTKLYKSGGIMWKGTYTTYRYKNDTFKTNSGELIRYYKNGQIELDGLLDNFGKALSWKTFDEKGNKTGESIATKIDSKAKKLIDFIRPDKHIITSFSNKLQNPGIVYQ